MTIGLGGGKCLSLGACLSYQYVLDYPRILITSTKIKILLTVWPSNYGQSEKDLQTDDPPISFPCAGELVNLTERGLGHSVRGDKL